MTLIDRWAVQSTTNTRYTFVYKEDIEERLQISDGGYFSLWGQCNLLTYIPPQHSNTNALESLREGCKVLPYDFSKGQVNRCFPSTIDYILQADPAFTPTSVAQERYVCQCHARAADTSSFSTKLKKTLHFLAKRYCQLWKEWKSTFPHGQVK